MLKPDIPMVGLGSTKLHRPRGSLLPKATGQVCSVHVKAVYVRLVRNVEQGKYPEKVNHRSMLLEV